MRPLSTRNGLVVCFGQIMDPVCATSIAEFSERHPEYNLLFVMSDWLTEDQIRLALVFWVVDPTAGLAEIREALRFGIPLLVPEESHVLRRVCIAGNCGLFFQSNQEATACLIYLMTNPVIRQSLGENAQRFFSQVRAAVQ